MNESPLMDDFDGRYHLWMEFGAKTMNAFCNGYEPNRDQLEEWIAECSGVTERLADLLQLGPESGLDGERLERTRKLLSSLRELEVFLDDAKYRSSGTILHR